MGGYVTLHPPPPQACRASLGRRAMSPVPPPHASRRQDSHRYDGFMNVIGGAESWSPVQPPLPGDNRLYSNMSRYWKQHSAFSADAESLYIQNGIATTIVDRPADDCFASGLEIEGDDDGLMFEEYDRLSVLATFSDAVRWARLFGASCILILAKDGGEWHDPLNLDTLDIVEDLQIFDLRHIKPADLLYTDPTDPKFGKPQLYNVNPPGGVTFRVHESRVLPITGEPLPIVSNKSNVWWLGRPALAACWDDIARYQQGLYWTNKLLERKQQSIYSMEGLGELFAQGLDAIVSKRINLVDMVRNNLNSVVVDKQDGYTIENLGLDNVQNVLMEYQVAICASSRFPSVLLFGKSATTLNASGAGELEQYYGMVGLIQSRIASPALEQLTSILWLQKHLKSKIPDTWEIKFNPLWKPSAKEQADTELVSAQAKSTEVSMLLTLVDAGIMMPEEARTIVINKYPEFEFAATPARSMGGDKEYAESVGGDDETEEDSG